ncbi:uncharacterized protein LOC121376771 isoform X2 [Gigantopelta aegis]|uniref:uncharacterized protein LOC121376771 isoform X2 n=1 Tax=Gigantopelta aegis TaxID=1735272 RepID=UPI001B888CE7|nr:uncharacterized protein LOC121376771 isoform X2 [Gigantopelta aegis]
MKPPKLSIEKMIHIINSEFPLRRRKHPEDFCYVCNRLDPSGKYPANPYQHLFTRGYFNRCPHATRAPHPTLTDFNSSTLPSDDELFDTDILNKDAQLPSVNKRNPKHFKIPPTFEKQNVGADGSLLPLVSERTFVGVQVGKRKGKGKGNKKNITELPPLSPGRNDLVVKGDEQRRKQRIPRPGHSKRSQNYDEQTGNDVEESRGKLLDVHIPSEFDSWKEDSDLVTANLKYQHRNKSGKYNMPGIGDDFYANNETISGGKRNRHKRTAGGFDPNRQGSYSISPSGSCSLSRGSSLTTPSPSQDFMMTVMKTSTWCECQDVDPDKLRCTECYCIGRHEKWCISKVQVCPTCGKAVKIRHAHSHKKRSTDISGSFHSFCNNQELKNEEQIVSADQAEEERKVKFADELNDYVSISGDELSAGGRKVKGDNSLLDKKKPLPAISPNIHKRAYLLALSDSVVKRLRKNSELFSRQGKGTYFSYFPLYKHKNYNPPVKCGLGISPRDEGDIKKVKKGMKHVLGDIKMADYYPGGKKYVPEVTDNI